MSLVKKKQFTAGQRISRARKSFVLTIIDKRRKKKPRRTSDKYQNTKLAECKHQISKIK